MKSLAEKLVKNELKESSLESYLKRDNVKLIAEDLSDIKSIKIALSKGHPGYLGVKKEDIIKVTKLNDFTKDGIKPSGYGFSFNDKKSSNGNIYIFIDETAENGEGLVDYNYREILCNKVYVIDNI